MRKLQIDDNDVMQIALQQEILRPEEARYDHRLHGVLLVSRGMDCYTVAEHLGQDPATVERWIHAFNARGFAALQPRRSRARWPPGAPQRRRGLRVSRYVSAFPACRMDAEGPDAPTPSEVANPESAQLARPQPVVEDDGEHRTPLGSNYLIQATSNLLSSWITLTDVALPSQPYIYIDYGSYTNGMQFYRAVPH